MTAEGRQVSAGRVARPHGLDGSFYVSGASEELGVGTEVTIAGRRAVVERRAGTAERPIIRLSGVGDRDAARGLSGEPLLMPAGELEEDEYLVDDLVGCDVPGLGTVRRVVNAPSCDLLEVGDDDTGKVIGRNGRTVQALRTVMRACGAKQDRRVLVDVVD